MHSRRKRLKTERRGAGFEFTARYSVLTSSVLPPVLLRCGTYKARIEVKIIFSYVYIPGAFIREEPKCSADNRTSRKKGVIIPPTLAQLRLFELTGPLGLGGGEFLST